MSVLNSTRKDIVLAFLGNKVSEYHMPIINKWPSYFIASGDIDNFICIFYSKVNIFIARVSVAKMLNHQRKETWDHGNKTHSKSL